MDREHAKFTPLITHVQAVYENTLWGERLSSLITIGIGPIWGKLAKAGPTGSGETGRFHVRLRIDFFSRLYIMCMYKENNARRLGGLSGACVIFLCGKF